MDENVIKEGTGADGRTYRVRMIQDDHPEMPYDDGSVPLWRVEHTGLGWHTNQVETTSYDASCHGLGDAIDRFGGPTTHLVERWLKAYHGVTVVETWHSGDAWYLAADTAHWRKAMGVESAQIEKEAERGSLMAEYKAWCAGDVWGHVIESKALAITTVVSIPDGDIIDTRRVDEWREEDAPIMGTYGHKYAEEAALEEFHAHLRDLDKQINAHLFETVYLKRPYDGITVNKGEPVSPLVNPHPAGPGHPHSTELKAD